MKPAPGISTKLRVAHTKLKTFGNSLRRFCHDGYGLSPYEQVNRSDPSLYRWSLRLAQKRRFPASKWSIWIDEITYHLRSALDAAVYDLSVAPERPDPTGTGFPIALDEGKFDGSLIRYLTEDQRAFIKSVQPYGRRDDPLWLLSQINRRNKHRAMQFTGAIFALDQQCLSNNMQITVKDIEPIRWVLRSAIRAKDGAEFIALFYRKIGPEPHVQVNLNVQIDIEFAERVITGDVPASGLMSRIVACVDEIIAGLYAVR